MISYDDIWGLAENNYGLITAEQAREMGVSNARLVVMAHRGALQRIGHGVYQVRHHVPGKHDGYALGVASVGKDAFLRSASVLGLLDLVPTNLSVLYVGSARRVRRRLDTGIRLKDRIPPVTSNYFGIRSEDVWQALHSAKAEGALDWDKLVEAADAACEKGYLTELQCAEFKKEVGA